MAEGGERALAEALAEVERLAAHPRVRVIGETGLDHYWVPDGDTAGAGRPGALLQSATSTWPSAPGKVLQIHDRHAHADVLRVLAEEGAPERTVFHCFSGDAAMARFCTDRGWYLSFAGTVTFGNAAPLREALHAVPLDRVLVETDAPYLAPAPYRGRPNAGYLVPLTLRRMADELGHDLGVPVPAHRRDQRGRVRPLVTPVLAECGDARRMRQIEGSDVRIRRASPQPTSTEGRSARRGSRSGHVRFKRFQPGLWAKSRT